jgi:Domain of unknown function (DUF5077)/Domain of unknown function (DUF3472)
MTAILNTPILNTKIFLHILNFLIMKSIIVKISFYFLGFFLIGLPLTSCQKNVEEQIPTTVINEETDKIEEQTASSRAAGDVIVPLGGNAYVTQGSIGTTTIGTTGLRKWSSASNTVSVYFKVKTAGTLTLSLRARVPSGSSKISVTALGSTFTSSMTGTTLKTYVLGTVNVAAAGYVKVDLKGVSKTGTNFADINDLIVNGTSTTQGVISGNVANDFYWTRRGPSVHMSYTIPSNTEYFYNEVTVPVGQDKIGSYFMANGFEGGYFGIQVNSATERRVLFSVWDPSNGTVSLVKKAANVTANGFSGEGTGGQSYLHFNWKAGTTYKFLTRVRPDGAGSTLFTSWFFAPETGSWVFIATWKQPNTTTYYTDAYSFLENFEENYGHEGRYAEYGNQWARTTNGTWTEATKGSFSVDATGSNNQRADYAGGKQGAKFFLKMNGFFNETVTPGSTFTRTASGVAPTINLSALPQ